MGRGAAVKGGGVHRRLDDGDEVCHLDVHLVVDVLVGGFHVVSAVVSRSLGAALNELVQAADLDVALAEVHDEVVEHRTNINHPSRSISTCVKTRRRFHVVLWAVVLVGIQRTALVVG